MLAWAGACIADQMQDICLELQLLSECSRPFQLKAKVDTCVQLADNL